jgi:Zn-dependent M28 family amino/carboxypeptidase
LQDLELSPEYDWDDYKKINVKDKIVLVLVNDPGFYTEDSSFFKGKQMTYYGRWIYKYNEAARQGATGIFVIHDTEPVGYPWNVAAYTGPELFIKKINSNYDRPSVDGWLSLNAAQKIFKKSGLNLKQEIQSALKRDFEVKSLGLSTSISITNKKSYFDSNNVLAILPGSQKPDECIVYVAHWDHLGIDPQLEGDNIFNGALDNASGVAVVPEIAEAFTKLSNKPKRSILFLLTTAEETLFLGSEYYVNNPIIPLNKTLAALNIDGLDIWGKMRDITIIGYGLSSLDNYVKHAANKYNRYIRQDPKPEAGSFFRSDQFNFARKGVPSIFFKSGIDHIKHGSKWGLEQIENWVETPYHKPSDELDGSWDLSGAIDDLRFQYYVGYTLANSHEFPEWNTSSEFREIRKKSLNTL